MDNRFQSVVATYGYRAEFAVTFVVRATCLNVGFSSLNYFDAGRKTGACTSLGTINIERQYDNQN